MANAGSLLLVSRLIILFTYLLAFTDARMKAPESSIIDDHYIQLNRRLAALEEREDVEAASRENEGSGEQDT